MHNAFINFGNEKMSKSLGNVVYAKDLIAQVGGAVVRLVILSTHYRMPVNFTEDTVTAASQEIQKMKMVNKQLALKLQTSGVDLSKGQATYIEPFLLALADDLNTANALTELYNVIKLANQELRTREADLEKLNNLFKSLNDMFMVLGLDIPYVKMSEDDLNLYQKYVKSKEIKDFATSDEVRNELIKRGIM